MGKQLYRLAVNLFILGTSVIICDQIIGTLLEHLYYKQKHGDDFTTIYAMTRASDSILVLGSSRASHHYKARQIAEATGVSCYNAGRDNMGIPYANAILSNILLRYTPRMIILDVQPTELSFNNNLAYERMAAVLLPLAARYPSLDRYIALAGKTEVLKRKASKIYAYNSQIGMMVQNTYTNMGHVSESGYEPLTGAIDTAIYKKNMREDIYENKPVNNFYETMLDDIVNTAHAHGIRLAVVVSPFYFRNNFSGNDGYAALKKKLAQHPEVIFLDFTNDTQFTGQPQLFYDDLHLNDSGATLYTRKVVAFLQERGVL